MAEHDLIMTIISYAILSNRCSYGDRLHCMRNSVDLTELQHDSMVPRMGNDRQKESEKRKKNTKTIDTLRYVTLADKCSTVCDEGKFCPGVRT